MRRAGDKALAKLVPVLLEVRKFDALIEKKPGIFYRKSEAFLHFHEDAAGLFADLKISGDYVRFRVSTGSERKAFLAAARKAAS
ncbi:MAG: hypothetical protein K8S25_06210 [Alphaproteobacteria bacterium]|nr:hypothetical protein [Alphaproteobacteria bacterium]